MDISIADLRTRITFQSPTVANGIDAAQTVAWSNVASPLAWSKWVFDHGDEIAQADAVRATARATVTVRYRSDILPTWSLLDESGTRWQIISPPENVQNLRRWTVFRVELVKGSL